jgi:hypothetical protein
MEAESEGKGNAGNPQFVEFIGGGGHNFHLWDIYTNDKRF